MNTNHPSEHRAINGKSWTEIDRLVWRIEERAIRSRDWETAKDADSIGDILRHLNPGCRGEERRIESDRSSSRRSC